jgi:hypothetical protein
VNRSTDPDDDEVSKYFFNGKNYCLVHFPPNAMRMTATEKQQKPDAPTAENQHKADELSAENQHKADELSAENQHKADELSAENQHKADAPTAENQHKADAPTTPGKPKKPRKPKPETKLERDTRDIEAGRAELLLNKCVRKGCELKDKASKHPAYEEWCKEKEEDVFGLIHLGRYV